MPEGDGLKEVVGDKGYHSNQELMDLEAVGVRSYISEPDRGRRNWKKNPEARDAVYRNRRRIRGARGKRLLRQRGERLERPCAHLYRDRSHAPGPPARSRQYPQAPVDPCRRRESRAAHATPRSASARLGVSRATHWPFFAAIWSLIRPETLWSAIPTLGRLSAPLADLFVARGDCSLLCARENRFHHGQLARFDFVARDAANRIFGRKGEKFVVEFERRRLHDGGQRGLVTRIEWTAQVRGDGAGYDVQSFNVEGTPRLIEVKTTCLGKYFPFNVTVNEVRCSEERPGEFQLYRVFNFGQDARPAVAAIADRVRRLAR